MRGKHKSSVRVSLMLTSAGWMQQKVELTLSHRAPVRMASDHLRCVAITKLFYGEMHQKQDPSLSVPASSAVSYLFIAESV